MLLGGCLRFELGVASSRQTSQRTMRELKRQRARACAVRVRHVDTRLEEGISQRGADSDPNRKEVRMKMVLSPLASEVEAGGVEKKLLP
eukprot:2318229-Rhodomonas_salina.1